MQCIVCRLNTINPATKKIKRKLNRDTSIQFYHVSQQNNFKTIIKFSKFDSGKEEIGTSVSDQIFILHWTCEN